MSVQTSTGGRPHQWLPSLREITVGHEPTLAVRDSGRDDKAPAVVLLHGLGLTSDLCWFGSYGPLAEACRVVAFDLRGHGSGLPVREHFSIEECADDVVAIAERLDLGRFVVVGYSIGGLVAQMTWRRHASALAGMVLCSTAHYPLSPLEWALRASPALGERWRRGFASHSVGPPAVVIDRLLHASDDGSAKKRAARRPSAIEPWVWASALQAAAKFDARPWINSIDIPTAVVVTSRDAVIVPWRQRQMAREIPNARTVEIAAGHLAPLRRPHRFSAAVVEAYKAVVHDRLLLPVD